MPSANELGDYGFGWSGSRLGKIAIVVHLNQTNPAEYD